MSDINARASEPTVVHGVLSYLPWSGAFIYRLICGLDGRADQVVLAHTVQNLDLFPPPALEQVSSAVFYRPAEALAAAGRLHRRCRPDILHAHMGYSGVRLLLFKHCLQVPMAVTLGGLGLVTEASRPAASAAYRWLFETAEALVAVSQDLRETAIDMGCPPEKIRVVHRGVDLAEFAPVDRSDRTDGPVRILMASRLYERKGHEDAIAACAGLPPSLPWRLEIAGGGPRENRLRALAARSGCGDRIAFLGRLTPEQLGERMQQADVFFHPAYTMPGGDKEGIPNAAIEAQATGLPVVATRHGGIPELVVDGETGLLAEERDVAALTEALACLLRERERRLSLGAAARRVVEEGFSLEGQVCAYLDTYAQLQAEFPPGSPNVRASFPGSGRPHLIRQMLAEEWRLDSARMTGAFDALAPPASGLRRGALGATRRMLPASVKNGLKRLVARWAPFVVERAAVRRAEEDDRLWGSLQADGLPDLEGPGSNTDN